MIDKNEFREIKNDEFVDDMIQKLLDSKKYLKINQISQAGTHYVEILEKEVKYICDAAYNLFNAEPMLLEIKGPNIYVEIYMVSIMIC